MALEVIDMFFEDFYDLFTGFSKEVTARRYNKMDYIVWRGMRDALNNSSADSVSVELWEKSIVISFDELYWKFKPYDNSFGSYLEQKLFRHNDYVVKDRVIDFGEYSENESVKEDKVMNFNFDFGPVDTSKVRMSMYGLAIKNKVGSWVSYNAAAGEIMDVDVFNFDGGKFLYKMPVATKDIAIGDVVIHNGYPMFVVYIPEDGKALGVVDTFNGERKEVMLPKSPFGFNFATKVVNFLGNMTAGAATAENPFGNMWMLMAMSGDTKMDDMLPLALMAGGNMDMSNPMLMWALMGNRTNDPMMLAMAMGAFNGSAATPHVCNCGGHCGEHHE